MAANGIHAATATMCIIVCVLIRKTLVQILHVLSGGHKKHTYDQLTSLPEGDEQKQRE